MSYVVAAGWPIADGNIMFGVRECDVDVMMRRTGRKDFSDCPYRPAMNGWFDAMGIGGIRHHSAEIDGTTLICKLNIGAGSCDDATVLIRGSGQC